MKNHHLCLHLFEFLIVCLFFHMFPTLVGSRIAVLQFYLHSTHSPQQSQPFTAWGLCLSVCCLQSIVSFQGRFNAMQKFANQLFWSSAYQTGLSWSSMRPVSLFVRFFCHSSSSWQKRCTSDPSSFSRLSFQYHIQQDRMSVRKPVCYCQVSSKVRGGSVAKCIQDKFEVLALNLSIFMQGNLPLSCFLNRNEGWTFMSPFQDFKTYKDFKKYDALLRIKWPNRSEVGSEF